MDPAGPAEPIAAFLKLIDWVVPYLKSALGSTALLGAVGYLFRTQIAHWLSSRLARDLEGIRAQAMRDLEAYKVTLIATAERAKAKAELEGSLALRHANLQYETLLEFSNQLSNACVRITTRLSLVPVEVQGDQEALARLYEELLADWDALATATDRSKIFRPPRDNLEALRLLRDLRSLIYHHLVELPSPLSDAAADALLVRVTAIQMQVDQEIKRLTTIAHEEPPARTG